MLVFNFCDWNPQRYLSRRNTVNLVSAEEAYTAYRLSTAILYTCIFYLAVIYELRTCSSRICSFLVDAQCRRTGYRQTFLVYQKLFDNILYKMIKQNRTSTGLAKSCLKSPRKIIYIVASPPELTGHPGFIASKQIYDVEICCISHYLLA